jgi:tetratricopeptide (TPR) repeat protein
MASGPGSRTRPFIGRERETQELLSGLADARAGRSRLTLIAGEPGIGKTRTCQELAAAARGDGVRTLWGPCHEGEGAPAYWPWIQILRAAVDGDPAASSEQALRAFPQVAQLLADAEASGDATPEQARFRLFDAVTRFLKDVARRTPLLLVLDDLHWADRPSLRLLRFLARELHEAPVLVVGTYRHTEVGPTHPLADVMGEATLGDRLLLGGLREPEVARFLEVSAGMAPPAALVSAVHGHTQGNPFFVGEVARLLALDAPGAAPTTASSVALVIPESVREVIRRRVDRLRPECRALLAIAAVAGADFEVGCVQRAADRPLAETLTLLDEAALAGLVETRPDGRGRYAFCHSLIRRVLYDQLTPLRRIELHRRLGEVLETLYGPARDDHLAELAHHFYEASLDGNADRAVDYATRAAAHALQRVAYEEAVSHFARALSALDAKGADERRRCELLAALGDAQMQAGESNLAKRTLREAADLARQLGAGELLARVALAFGWWVEPGKTDHYLVDLLEEAARMLPPDDSALRARVLAHLAAELWYTGTPERRTTLSQEAVAMARRVGDTRALTFALSSRHLALWGPANVEERLAVAGEVVQRATAIGDTERVMQGRVWQVVDFLELGDIQAVDVGIALCERLADDLRQPGYHWWVEIFRGMRALLDGRFGAAETLIHQAFATGQHAQNENATQVFATQMFLLRREQGRLAELEPAFKGMVEQYPDIPSWRCGLAMLYAQLDRLEEARTEFERIAVRDFADLPRDLFWLIGMALLADVCCSLGDHARAAVLYDLLLPYADRTMVTGRAVVCAGSARHWLAVLAALQGRHAEAEAHFERALAMNLRLGARAFTSYTRFEYGRMLLQRGEAADRTRAVALLHAARATAGEIGMGLLTRRLDAMAAGMPELAAPPAAVPPPTPSSRSLTQEAAFRRDDRTWTIAFAGTTVRVKDAKGLRWVAALLQHPGRQVHALDLIAAQDADDAGTAAGLQHALGDAGEFLDRKARDAYKQRLDDLHERFDEAKAAGAVDAATRLEDEIAFLTRELARAVGLGGRERRAGSAAERARLNVTRAIKAAEDTIAALHPALGDYLRATIRTGTFCAYEPDPELSVVWSF